MSLVLNFSICTSKDCKSLVFTETTGAYSINNTSGWGLPNPIIADALTAILEITTPNNQIFTINLYNTFPTTNSTITENITNLDLGLISSSKFNDGLYIFKYTVTTASNTYTQTIEKLLYCNASCCVDKMFSLIKDPSCDCSKDSVDKAMKAYTLLTTLKYAAECGNTSVFSSILDGLNKLCLNNNCSNCN